MYIGVDVKDTKISIGLVNDKGAVSFQSFLPVDPKNDPDSVIMEIIFIIKSLSESVPLELFNDRPTGIGIGIQDNLDKDSGIIVQCANPEFKSISQREMIERHFDLPVYIDNHTAAEALAVNEIGADKGNAAGIIAAAMLCKYLK